MKRSVWVILSLLVCLSALIFWSVLSPQKQIQTKKAAQVNDIKPKTISDPQMRKAFPALASESEEEDDFDPYETELLKAQLQGIADAYEESSKYPLWSQPVTNPEAVRDPKPFEVNEVGLPYPGEDEDFENAVRLSVATESHQYFKGQNIKVRVRLSGAPSDTFTEATGYITRANGNAPYPIVLQPNNASLTEFVAEIDTKIVPPELMAMEMEVVVKVKMGDREMINTAPFKYSQPSASVVGTLPARVEGPNLVIPTEITVMQAGYYFLSAVLEDVSSRKPLIALQKEGRLNLGNGLLNLQAHIAALKVNQSEGPYILRSVRLFRGGEPGEGRDVPGTTNQPEYPVQGFPFSNYEDVEYVDELAQERLALLRQMGSVDEEAVRERIRQEQE